MDQFADQFARGFSTAAGIASPPSASWRVPPPEMLADVLGAAITGLKSALDVPGVADDPGIPVAWANAVADRLARNAEPVFAHRERAAARTAAAIRLAALCLAGEMDALEHRDVGDQFRDVAAGITWLEQRASGKLPATEVLMLAVK
jgi:hypothetical protein